MRLILAPDIDSQLQHVRLAIISSISAESASSLAKFSIAGMI